MTKYILASMAALFLALTPAISVAQGENKSADEGNKIKMKGPPNADGYKGEPKSGGNDSNGAAAAKATGEDKK